MNKYKTKLRDNRFRQSLALSLLLFALFPSLESMAQSNSRDHIRLGNRAYRDQQYDQAETFYLRSLAKEHSYEAFYNLGNAYLMQGKDSTAAAQLMNADSLGTVNPQKRAKTYHNLGNIWYAQGSSLLKSNQDATGAFQKAVEYYKSSLRCNPTDDETRYNMVKAQFQLKKSQQNNQNKQQNQQDQKQDQQEKQKQEKQEQKQQQQPQPQEEKNQMSEQAAEQLLNSARQDEKKVQEKMKSPKASRRSLEKDW